MASIDGGDVGDEIGGDVGDGSTSVGMGEVDCVDTLVGMAGASAVPQETSKGSTSTAMAAVGKHTDGRHILIFLRRVSWMRLPSVVVIIWPAVLPPMAQYLG